MKRFPQPGTVHMYGFSPREEATRAELNPLTLLILWERIPQQEGRAGDRPLEEAEL